MQKEVDTSPAVCRPCRKRIDAKWILGLPAKREGYYGAMSEMTMTALRRDAYSLLDRMPEDKLLFLVEIMKGIEGLTPPKKATENSPAFRRLMELRRPIPDLNEENELTQWREEKFGHAGVD